MTTPSEDPGPLDDIGQALAALRATILEFFQNNPPDEAHQQLDKDQLHEHILTRIQQQSDISAQAAEVHAASQTEAPKTQLHPAAPHVTPPAPHVTPAAPHAAPTTPHATPAAVQTTPAAPHTTPATTHAAGSTHAEASHAPAPKAGTEHADKKAPGTGKKGEPPEDAELSGPQWADRFPMEHALGSLEGPFKGNFERFKEALEAAGIHVEIIDTKRPEPRAYLMHWSWRIAHGRATVAEADQDRMDDVKIRWKHPTDAESLKAAKELCRRFEIAANLKDAPGRHSNHVKGWAVDMHTTWSKATIEILNADKEKVTITGLRTGMNRKLWEVGKTFKVVHYGLWPGADFSRPEHDEFHWSIDGH